jgi:hypothetical protein
MAIDPPRRSTRSLVVSSQWITALSTKRGFLEIDDHLV